MESYLDEVKTAKGEQTRALILETALRLFRERGYEKTTMRAIADEAGVALGSTYYYFRSKESLIQAFYYRTHEEHLAASLPILARERSLKGRLLGVMRAKLASIEPYHRFSGVLFRTAADPESPLNPFSADSRPARDQSIALFRELVTGSDARIPEELLAELPELLWTYHMGIVLYWIHDSSPGRRRTHKLVEHTVDLVVRLISLGSLPFMGPLRRSVLHLIEDLREPESG